jgi:hypothetical protein
MLLIQINPRLLTNKVARRILCGELDQNRSKSWSQGIVLSKNMKNTALEPRKCPDIESTIIKPQTGILGL